VLGDFETGAAGIDQEAVVPCHEGDSRCNDEYLLACKADESGWELESICWTPNQCDSNNGVCKVCKASALRCNGAKREGCAADGSGWETIEDCDAPELCNNSFCGQCPVENEVRCAAASGDENAATDVLQQCYKGVGWQVLDTCANEQLCEASVDRWMTDPGTWLGECDQPVCTAGTLECDGPTLRRCPQTEDAWVVVDTCASDALCLLALDSADSAEDAATVDECPVGCSPAGGFFCDGPVLQRCRDDLTGREEIERCPEGTACDPVLGECGSPCTVGALRCNGAQLEVCNEQQEWELQELCASVALCSAVQDPTTEQWSGVCQPPACDLAGLFKCDGATLFECNSDLTSWDPRVTCLSPALCNALSGRCDPEACLEAGLLRCNPVNPLIVEQCSADLTEWVLVAECSEQQSCNPDPDGPACLDGCPEPPARCIGTERQDCDDAAGIPVWTTVASCFTPELCECGLTNTCLMGIWTLDGVCGRPACGGLLADYQCAESILQGCTEGRNEWVDLQDCGAPELCYDDDPEAGVCRVCPAPLEVQCFESETGPARRTCAPDGLSWTDQANCPFGCVDSGEADYCAVCATDELRCGLAAEDDAILQRCTTDQTDFVLEEDCLFTCVDSGLADLCAVCQADELRCSLDATAIERCNEDLLGLTTDVECPRSCIDNGYTDFCGDCTTGQTQCATDFATVHTCIDGLWGAGQSCVYGCIDSDTADFCAPQCTPQESECVSTTSLRLCNAVGEWGDAAACAIACIDSGTMDFCAPSCAPGATECATSNSYRECNSETGEWADLTVTCTGTTPVCVAGGCVQCDPSTTPPECADDAVLQTCEGNVLVRTDCPAATPVCTVVGGTAGCHACAPGRTACADSSTLQTCSDTGTWSSAACAGDQVCGQINNVAGCYYCLPPLLECVTTNTYRTCLADGSWSATEACPNLADCSNSECEACADNAKECVVDDSTIRTCVEGSWGANTACTAGCFGDYPDAYCGGCTADERQCSTDGVPQTCVNGQWQDGAPCSEPNFCLDGFQMCPPVSS
jgi:hypothetical protein